jgi:hypothetical protein
MTKTTETRAETVKRERRKRQDTGETRGLKLHVPAHLKEPGFAYRFVNEATVGRIHEMSNEDDWDVVRDPNIKTDGEGTPVTRVVNKVTGERAYLMKKPLDWYKEDRKAKQRKVDEREDAIRLGQTPAGPGGTPLGAGDRSYIPDRHEGFSSDKQGVNQIGTRRDSYQP